MIDIKKLRENPEPYRKSLKGRGGDQDLIDKFFALDEQWRRNIRIINELRSRRNSLSIEISQMIKRKENVETLKEEVKNINEELKVLEESQGNVENERERTVSRIPNLLNETVPVCFGDENSKFVKFSGKARVREENLEEFMKYTENAGKYEITDKTYSHIDLTDRMGLVDLDRAGKISGARFYISRNQLVKLELALINYAIDFIGQRGFSIVEPPPMINGNAIWKATDEGSFNEAVYKIEGEDLYLISTSEHPIASMLMDEIIELKELPLKVSGFSPCFRKEAGAHGKDTKGIFRVHYFKKVEQFIFCKPEDSWDYLEELLKNTEDLMESLGLPYRVINVCSGELGSLAAKKYDIEGWFPHQGKFRELASISNDTDYQARSLNIKYRSSEGNQFVHTLNGTAVATTRAMVAIMENFSTENRINIPETLIPYTGFDSITV
ncbi:MAG: serine--tRNA ligase [Cuniculiplasma sp.]